MQRSSGNATTRCGLSCGGHCRGYRLRPGWNHQVPRSMLQVVLPDSPARGAARLSWQICERVDDIDRAAWERVCRPGDWGMALTVLAVQQSALADQARCWFALVRDANGTPLAAAALALFRVDVIQSQGTLARLAAGTRRLVPGFLKM